jgi:hypothetical protein
LDYAGRHPGNDTLGSLNVQYGDVTPSVGDNVKPVLQYTPFAPTCAGHVGAGVLVVVAAAVVGAAVVGLTVVGVCVVGAAVVGLGESVNAAAGNGV